MKHTDTSLHHASTADWQLLGEFQLTLKLDASQAVSEWLAVTLDPLQLHADFTSKIVKSAEEAAARAMQSETVMKYQHTHLLIYIPANRPATGGTWGFFRIEKVGTDTERGSPRDHSIEFYLYLEGQ
ncbi:MAG TPA: hypothetical protein VJ821_17850 [Anaerolineales bacterium]|nr:hypothetical protein [Anaerolineales bacterium]